QPAEAATLVGDEDSAFAGGSYVIVQKYLHDVARWNKVPVEEQENIIGRHKLSDIEQPDSVKKPYAHNVLTSIEENGEQLQILRDNMPFGEVGKGEFGTYFIGYARSPYRIEKMLENMFIGNPPGTYDHLLDFSHTLTGCLFFVPTVTFLDDVNPEAQPVADTDAKKARAPVAPQPNARSSDGSLGIGSLKKEAGHE
ncbi:MAG TPA: peroxidase, partial [Afipia sp.]|nr:peroxidase [Afipia sp.]